MMDEAYLDALPLGSVVKTVWGNGLRRFGDGWSPLNGAHWDRRTVYTSREVARNFTLICEGES
jgi:hypothetical protein